MELGIWEALFPGFRLGTSIERRLHVLERFLPRARRVGVDFKGMEWIVGMAVVLAKSPPAVRFAAMDRLGLRPAERREMSICFDCWPQVEQFLGGKKNPRNSEIYLFFKPYGPAPLLFWMTCMKRWQSRRHVVRHLLSWTPLRGELTGDDLVGMGLKGSEIGEVLQGIRLARMDGRL